MEKVFTIPILEEYTKNNNIEYNFLLTTDYSLDEQYIIKEIEKAFLTMVDRNNNILQFEEIDCSNINGGILYRNDIIPYVIRLIRQQKLKELGI